MSSITHRTAGALASTSILALAIALGAGSAHAATLAPSTATDGPNRTDAPEVQEIVVTAARSKAADVAPVASSLKTTEPEAIITRKFIEESAPRVGDYTTTAILAPSMATTPNSNGPGSTDGAKITLRGFQDGEFNVTYDGIAWGDTNGPSHHSNSFFPSSVIGGVVIDRGPGKASDLGQANFGGSVNLFSLPFEDQMGVRQTLTAGSFGTYQSVTTLATGPLNDGWHGANFVLNFMEYQTDGYLTNSPSDGQNQFIKGTLPINNKWSLTALFTHNTDEYNQGDNSANASLAQTTLFGKRFALSNDPTLPTFKGYNFTHKDTDFEYLRVNGDLGHGLTIEDTAYSYYYHNTTLSANNNAADQSLDLTFNGTNFVTAAGVGPNLLAADKVTTFANNIPTAAYPAAGSGYSKSLQTAGIPGYTKRNQYRVYGDIFKGHDDFGFGLLTFGALYEHAYTQRARFDFDLVSGLSDFREKAAALPGPSGCENLPVRNGICENPLNINTSEYSGWDQYQLFADFDWRVTDKLTVTPGVKYINFELHVHAPEEATSGSIQPTRADQTFTKTLPFLTVNYRFRPQWAFYAQYAQGFLVPNISVFDVNAPQANNVVPQESTNYQIGTVFSAGKLTVDADAYYIDFKHKIQTITVIDPTSPLNGDSVTSNSGGATYKGVELQGTYLLPYGFSTFGNLTVNQAVAKDDPLNPGGNGKQLAKAPRGTAAIGLRYEHHNLFHDGDDIVTNLNNKWIGQQFQTASNGAAGPTGLIHGFNEANWTTTYKVNHYSIEFQVLDLLDHKDITSFKGKGLLAGTNTPVTNLMQVAGQSVSVISAAGANVFTYQTGRSVQVTLKAAF